MSTICRQNRNTFPKWIKLDTVSIGMLSHSWGSVASNACRLCGCTRWLRTRNWSWLMSCPTPMVLAQLLSHKPVSGCQLLTHIKSSCSDTTFVQEIPYCLAGNGTLVCTDRYIGVFFCSHCTVSPVLNVEVNVFDSSCFAPTGYPSLFSDISWNVT